MIIYILKTSFCHLTHPWKHQQNYVYITVNNQNVEHQATSTSVKE